MKPRKKLEDKTMTTGGCTIARDGKAQLTTIIGNCSSIVLGVDKDQKPVEGVRVWLQLWPGDEIEIVGYDDPSKIFVECINSGTPTSISWASRKKRGLG